LLHGSVGLAKELKDNHSYSRAITASIVGKDGVFRNYGEVPRGLTGVFELGVSRQVTDELSVQVDYDGEYGSNYIAHSISASINLAF